MKLKIIKIENLTSKKKRWSPRRIELCMAIHSAMAVFIRMVGVLRQSNPGSYRE
jgi:hypothetical protein